MINQQFDPPVTYEQITFEDKMDNERERIQEQLNIARAKLNGEFPWENWETKGGLEKWIKRLEASKKILDDYSGDFKPWIIRYPKQIGDQNSNTDSRLAQWIFELLKDKINPGMIVDVCGGDGSLIVPWKEAGYKSFEIELDESSSANIKMDFFSIANWSDFCPQVPSLVLCNPSDHHLSWLEKITELFGKSQPTVLFSNPRHRIAEELEDDLYQKWLSGRLPEIKSIVTLYLKMREDKINYNCELLLFGIDDLKPHYFFQPLKNT